MYNLVTEKMGVKASWMIILKTNDNVSSYNSSTSLALT